jgi:hypothetical protein
MMCTPETTSSTGGCRDAARAVSGAIVDHDDLVSGAAELRNDAPDHVRLVVGGANDPNTEAGGSGLCCSGPGPFRLSSPMSATLWLAAC